MEAGKILIIQKGYQLRVSFGQTLMNFIQIFVGSKFSRCCCWSSSDHTTSCWNDFSLFLYHICSCTYWLKTLAKSPNLSKCILARHFTVKAHAMWTISKLWIRLIMIIFTSRISCEQLLIIIFIRECNWLIDLCCWCSMTITYASTNNTSESHIFTCSCLRNSGWRVFGSNDTSCWIAIMVFGF